MSLHLSCEPLLLSPALLAEGDILDADLGERLPMALLFRVVFAALVLEDDDFFALAVLDDLAGDVRTLDRRSADVTLVTIGAEDDVVEGDLRARLANEGGNSDCFSGLGLELLTAGSDDRVSHGLCYGYRVRTSLVS